MLHQNWMMQDKCKIGQQKLNRIKKLKRDMWGRGEINMVTIYVAFIFRSFSSASRNWWSGFFWAIHSKYGLLIWCNVFCTLSTFRMKGEKIKKWKLWTSSCCVVWFVVVLCYGKNVNNTDVPSFEKQETFLGRKIYKEIIFSKTTLSFCRWYLSSLF